MNKKSKVSILLLVFFATVACEESFTSDSNESSVDSSSDVIPSPQNQPQSSNPDENTYNKICESWVNEDVFSKSVNYSLDSTLSLSEANELVNNDLTNNYNQVSRTKFSSIERTKKDLQCAISLLLEM